MNRPIDSAAEFSGGERLCGFPVQFRKPRQQPRLRLPEAKPPNGNGQSVMTVAYFTGWRVPSELLTRKRTHVANGMLVLEAYEGKNEQPRKFPLDMIPELNETIERQLEATRKLEIESGRVIPWLFHNNGNRIVDYLPALRKAIKAAGPAAGLTGRIPHDFRKTAARNLINAGVDPLTTMALVGWEDIGMLKRYNIIDEKTLKRGAAKLSAYHDEQKAQPGNVVAIRG